MPVGAGGGRANSPSHLVDEGCCGIPRSLPFHLTISVRTEWFGVIMFVRVGGFEGGVFWSLGWGVEMFRDLESPRK